MSRQYLLTGEVTTITRELENLKFCRFCGGVFKINILIFIHMSILLYRLFAGISKLYSHLSFCCVFFAAVCVSGHLLISENSAFFSEATSFPTMRVDGWFKFKVWERKKKE